MTAGYSENGISGKTILALILLIVDVALFFLCGHSAAVSSASHGPIQFPAIPEGMHITFIKDMDLKKYGRDTVHFSSGTVVTPCDIHNRGVYFFYSENKEVLERFERLNAGDKLMKANDMGVIMFDAGLDCFAEQEQLEAIYNEAQEKTKAMHESAFKEEFEPVIIKGVILLAIGLFLTYAFSMMKWHSFLYVVDIIGFFVILFGFIS
jgi:hypothetical protein